MSADRALIGAVLRIERFLDMWDRSDVVAKLPGGGAHLVTFGKGQPTLSRQDLRLLIAEFEKGSSSQGGAA